MAYLSFNDSFNSNLKFTTDNAEENEEMLKKDLPLRYTCQAQVSVFPFMHSPANSAQDTNAVSYNIMWPIKDLKFNEGIYKDNLLGYSEERFRSARLHTWFYTPNDYFAKSLEALRSKAIDYDVEGNFNKIQDGTPLRGSLDLPKVKIFSEDKQVVSSVKDERFEIVSDVTDAHVCWSLGLNRSEIVKQVRDKDVIIN